MPEAGAPSPTAEVARLVDEATKSGRGLAEEVLVNIAKELTKLFSVKAEEIAILQLSDDSTMLGFLYPIKLRQIGKIPMTTTNSLAVRTARDKRPEMINNFPAHKHPTVFESVNLEESAQERQPIQKIMSAPLLVDSKAIGVIQVSRKGKTPTTAGADFSIRDLTALISTAGLLAKCFRK